MATGDGDACLALQLRHAPQRFNASLLPVIAATDYAVFILCTILLSISLVAAFLGRGLAHLKSRPFPLIVLGHTGAFLNLVTGCWVSVTSGMIPCPAAVMLPILVVPFLALPYAIRLNLFARNYLLNKRAQHVVQTRFINAMVSASPPAGTLRSVRTADTLMSSSHMGDGTSSSKLLCRSCQTLAVMVLRMLTFETASSLGRHATTNQHHTNNNNDPAAGGNSNNSNTVLAPHHSFSTEATTNNMDDDDEDSEDGRQESSDIRIIRFMVSTMGVVMQFTLLFAPFAILALVMLLNDPDYTSPCSGCVLSGTVKFTIVGATVGSVAWLALAWLINRRHFRNNDPFGLLVELKVGLIFGVLALLFYALHVIVHPEFPGPGNTPRDGFSFISLVAIFLTLLALVSGLFVAMVAQYHEMELRRASQGAAGDELPPQQVLGIQASAPQLVNSTRNKRASTLTNSNKHTTARPPTAEAREWWRSQLSTGSRINMAELLKQINSPPFPNKAHQLFEDYLTGELAVEGLKFMDCVREWTETYFDLAPTAINVRARKIVRLFIGHESDFPINVSDVVAIRLKQAVLGPEYVEPRNSRGKKTPATASSPPPPPPPSQNTNTNKPPPPPLPPRKSARSSLDGGSMEEPAIIAVPFGVFDEAIDEVSKMLQHGPLHRFSKTAAFARLVDEGEIDISKCMHRSLMRNGGAVAVSLAMELSSGVSASLSSVNSSQVSAGNSSNTNMAV